MSDSQSGTPVATGKDVTIHAMQLTAWNGALPPPEMAKAYEEICKGAFERILVMAEQEAVARRRMTEADHEEYNRSVKSGMRLAFVLTLAAFAGAIACAAMGCEKAAMVFVGATVVNLAATFIGRKSK